MGNFEKHIQDIKTICPWCKMGLEDHDLLALLEKRLAKGRESNHSGYACAETSQPLRGRF